jgi:hypothetical protein
MWSRLGGCGRSAGRTWLPPNSLFIRELTGNFLRLTPSLIKPLANDPVDSIGSAEIPCKFNRKLFCSNREFCSKNWENPDAVSNQFVLFCIRGGNGL